MRYYKNSGFYITIIIIVYILNIKYLNGITIKCNQCNYSYEDKKCKSDLGECPSYCRPHFYDVQCYDCSTVFKSNTNLLYSISENECIPPITDYNRNIISETNEVVKNEEANNKIKADTNLGIKMFGNFIYKICPTYTVGTLFSGYNYCKCTDTTNSFLYADKIFDLDHFRCVNTCPQGYYFYYNTLGNYLCKRLEDIPPPDCIRSNNLLTENCDSGQPFLVEHIKIGSRQYYYCLSACPASLPFYKNTTSVNSGIKCLDKCPDNYFYYSDTKECIEKCDNYQSWIDIESKIFICVRPSSTESNCPPEFPYKYGSSCLRNCSDTNKDFFSFTHFGSNDLKKQTYSLVTSNKRCVEDCNSADDNDGKIYHEKVTFTCVSDCTKTSRKYNKDYECVESCSGDKEFHNYGLFECVNNCNNPYQYKSDEDKTCYDDCRKLSPIFYYDKNTEMCFNKCGNLNFIYKHQNTDNSYSLYCLESCNTQIKIGTTSVTRPNFVHRYNDNLCIQNCTINSDMSTYYRIKEDDTCYQSCEEVNKYKYRNEYIAGTKHFKYEYESECFPSDSSFSNQLHYTMKSGIVKYKSTTESDLEFCSKAGFYYINRASNECKTCDGYKIPY